MIKILEAGKALSTDVIDLFESFLDVGLPRSYRNFLKMNNGGKPEPDCFNFHSGKEGSSIHFFYGINVDPSYDLVKSLKVYKSRIPIDTLPIAYDQGGNLLCLVLKGPKRGEIYFWDHEFEKNDGEAADYSNMILVSENFNDFLESLYFL